MNIQLKIISLLVFVLAWSDISAQDIHFSQFSESPLTLNPALTGSFNGVARATTNYKDQWKSVASAYKTFAISADGKLLQKQWEKAYLGVGMLIFVDKAGDAELTTSNYNFNLAGGVNIDENSTLAGGISTAFCSRSINYSALNFGNQYDASGNLNPSTPSGENLTNNKISFFDLGAGINYNYSMGEMYSSANDNLRFNIGFAYYHINHPLNSFLGSAEQLYGKFVLHGNAQIGIQNTLYSIVPSILYLRQGPYQEITAGAMLRIMLQEASKYTGFFKESAISFGGNYRFGDAFIITTYLQVTNYGLGISYDLNTSDLRAASSLRGGLEIALRYIMPVVK